MKEMGTPEVCIHMLNKVVWAKEKGMFHTISVNVCPENVMNMRTHQTSSTDW